MKGISFEDKVRAGLSQCNKGSLKAVGAAVSGGADSVSLLLSLHAILGPDSKLYCITVNHNLRPAEETSGDADFVQELCRKLDVECKRYDIPRGKIIEAAETFDTGIEDAARRLRYQCFEDFIAEKKLDCLCLAHNANDMTETILMRFLHGSGTGELSGIPRVRGKYIRPLLDISRKEIEEYVSSLGYTWRTDSTNADNAMMRNKLRNKIIPFLNEEVEGWQNAVKGLSSKCADDEAYLQSVVQEKLIECGYSVSVCEEKAEGFEDSSNLKKGNKKVSMNYLSFMKQSAAIRRRLVYAAVKDIVASSRIPYSFVQQVMNLKKGEKLSCSGLEVQEENNAITVQKCMTVATEQSFFVIIEEIGNFQAGPWNLTVNKENCSIVIETVKNGKSLAVSLDGMEFPFAVRSRQNGDEVKAADGTYRNLSRILKDWKAEDLKDEIMIIQHMKSSCIDIKAVWGEPCGCRNWIVK